MFGWEAQCLIIEQHVRPVVAGQLSKVSATALGREKREGKRTPKDKKEAEDRARDKRDAEKGAPILEKIAETEYFQIMPAYKKAAWVRAHGRWPGEAELAEALHLTDPELAREIIADLRDGHLKGFKLFIKDRRLIMKLSVTATLKRMRP